MSLPLVNTAKHTVKLPGCGMNVEYRPFFVKEQKILLQATESEDPAQIASATNDMVRACTFEKLNLEDITRFICLSCRNSKDYCHSFYQHLQMSFAR